MTNTRRIRLATEYAATATLDAARQWLHIFERAAEKLPHLSDDPRVAREVFDRASEARNNADRLWRAARDHVACCSLCFGTQRIGDDAPPALRICAECRSDEGAALDRRRLPALATMAAPVSHALAHIVVRFADHNADDEQIAAWVWASVNRATADYLNADEALSLLASYPGTWADFVREALSGPLDL